MSIQQSIQDVIIECCLREEAVTGQEASLQSIPNSLDKASKSSNPSVQLLRSAVNLSSETSDNFIRDIQEALTASCSLLETLVIPNADSQWIIVSRLRQQPAGLSSTSTDVSPMMYAYQISCGDVQITARTLAACITLSHTEFTLYVYNWNKGIADDLFGRMLRLLSWNNIRMQFIAARTLARISRHIPPWEISTNEAIVTESNRSDNSAAAASEELLLLQKKAVEFIDWYVRIKSRNSLGNSIMESARLEKNASATSKSSAASSTANDILSSTSSTVASGNSSSGVDSYYSDRKYLSRRTSQFDISDSPSPSELAKLVRTAKLIHFARYPFFFTELREKVLSQLTGRSASLTRQWTTTLTSPNIHEGIRAAPLFDSDLEWTRHTIDAFLREYSEYLCSVGFEIINREERSSLIILSNDHGSINPTFIVNETSSIVSEIVYLRLRCSKGVVIAQIGFEDVYAHIYLYSLDTMEDASPAETPRSFRLASEKPDFSLECEMIKKSIHLFSCKNGDMCSNVSIFSSHPSYLYR